MFIRKIENHTYIIKNFGTQVLVVASCDGISMMWCAYIGAVIGINHRIEWKSVKDYGTRLDYNIAKVIFPIPDKEYVWRL